MNYKHVVTSFLMAEQRILLLHRSDKVGTHRGKWSGVSGYLEGDEQPLMRALTEIREETGLSAEQVSLVRMGEALRAFDESTGTVWIIHPFLLETKSNAIRLDWENTEYAWVAPSNLTSYDMVPKLGQAFDRVRFDLQSVPASLTDVTHNVEALKTIKFMEPPTLPDVQSDYCPKPPKLQMPRTQTPCFLISCSPRQGCGEFNLQWRMCGT